MGCLINVVEEKWLFILVLLYLSCNDFLNIEKLLSIIPYPMCKAYF